MSKIVDARKLDCPEPVIRTRQALGENNDVITIVDNEIARENVCRMAKSEGCDITVETKPDGIYLTMKKGTAPQKAAAPGPGVVAGTVLFLGSDLIGRGENLGQRLEHVFTLRLGQKSQQVGR